MSISELYRAIGPATGVQPASGGVNPKEVPSRPHGPSEFQSILTREQGTVKLSQHAETRIRSRVIPWNESIEKRISQGIDQASEKGSRETLILADEIAVIANVKSRTVITAMDRSQLKEKIFTNIDSAVLV